MRLLTAVSLVRAQQGEPKKSRLPFGSLLFLSFVLFAQTNCPCAQRPSAVNWRSRCRCRWQKKAARAHGRHPCFTRALVPMENTLVPTRSVVSAARQGNPGHRKSRLDTRKLPTAQAEFHLPLCRPFCFFGLKYNFFTHLMISWFYDII